MNDSELMTVNEVAALFGVTRRTIFRWMNKIKGWPVPVTPVGARIKFIRSEIMAFYYSKASRKINLQQHTINSIFRVATHKQVFKSHI
ncbi:Predicted transcriptional regulator [Escherichia coli]|nr:hypothetical protein BvCmsKSNP039_00110 [Escherichia coli]CTX57363.1 Predicted transcriptional regulator [Escherichia coli]